MIQPVLAAALLLAQAAPSPPCLSPGEAADVLAATLPSMVDALAERCSASLPSGAFLRTGAGAFAHRLRAETASRATETGRAMAKVFGSDMPAGVKPETLVQLFGESMAGEMLKDVKVRDCPTADRLVAALAPLPARNLGTVVATFVEMGSGGDGNTSFAICDTRL